MKVTACVVSFNTAQHLPGALDSLLAQDHPDLDIVVVDNASHDGSADVARAHDPGVRVIANPDNRGFAGAANQGIALAPDGAFMVLNPDVRLATDHVSRLVAAMDDNPRVASLQGRLWRMDGDGQPILTGDGHKLIDTTGHTAHTNRVFRNRGGAEPDTGQYDAPADIFGVSGCAALYRLDALHDVAVDGEVYDEDLFAFFEDVDLDWRFKARGWTSRYVPGATGLHERGGEFARRSTFVERLSYRNWFLVVLKNDDPVSLLRQAHLMGATTMLRTLDIAATVPTAFVRAVVDDVRLAPATLRRRRAADLRRTVDNREIVAEWFGAFDYADWFAQRFGRSWLGRRLDRPA